MELFERLAAIFFPTRCIFCGVVVEYDDFHCEQCDFSRIVALDFAFGSRLRLAAALEYKGNVKNILLSLKENHDKRICRFLAEQMYKAFAEDFGGVEFDVIVPVPATQKTLKEKGFNHAGLLAEYLSDLIGVPTSDEVLVRVEGSISQYGLNRRQRFENAEKSYKIAGYKDINEKVILIVDDTVTTGSTINACAEQLMGAGASAVFAVAAAGVRLD